MNLGEKVDTGLRMSFEAPKSLAELLGSGNLGQLADEARTRRDATARYRALLPAEEASHLLSACEGADGEIILTMDSPAWAARARYCAESLGGRRFRVRVAPART
jgi:hypothetical protein